MTGCPRDGTCERYLELTRLIEEKIGELAELRESQSLHTILASHDVPCEPIQTTLLAQSAARAYPDRFRLLGGEVRGGTDVT